ncbi:hypothetical protein IWQ60_004936 [Tieghemiomyces parasiticus]|uniref:Ribosome assembly protein 3 n=1 Tax=Tieghemiomyces parasiticus TaxID=78921 RepID=A0A9W8AA19_9FUNG|nr:hypothetical protein IWQ60_004936 [Tieghemiomyces parasiticus]
MGKQNQAEAASTPLRFEIPAAMETDESSVDQFTASEPEDENMEADDQGASDQEPEGNSEMQEHLNRLAKFVNNLALQVETPIVPVSGPAKKAYSLVRGVNTLAKSRGQQNSQAKAALFQALQSLSQQTGQYVELRGISPSDQQAGETPVEASRRAGKEDVWRDLCTLTDRLLNCLSYYLPTISAACELESMKVKQQMRDTAKREFKDYYMARVTETFSDELETLRQNEEISDAKLELLIDSLEAGVMVFDDKEVLLTANTR